MRCVKNPLEAATTARTLTLRRRSAAVENAVPGCSNGFPTEEGHWALGDGRGVVVSEGGVGLRERGAGGGGRLVELIDVWGLIRILLDRAICSSNRNYCI